MKMIRGLMASLALVLFASVVAPVAQADDARVVIVAKAAVDLASLADGAGSTTTVTVPGAVLGDSCLASFGVDVQGMLVTCYVSAANVASVRVQNETTGAVDLASTTVRVYLHQRGTR